MVIYRLLYNLEVDNHCCLIFLTVSVFVYYCLTNGVSLSSCESSRILTYVASVFVRVELSEDTCVAVVVADGSS